MEMILRVLLPLEERADYRGLVGYMKDESSSARRRKRGRGPMFYTRFADARS